MREVKSAVWATLLLIPACANGRADTFSTFDSLPSGAGGHRDGSSTGSVSAGGAGSGGSGGAAATPAGSTGTAGTDVSSAGSAGSAGASGAAGGSGDNGSTGDTPDAGGDDAGDDVVADVTLETGAADTSCVAESNAAFCVRLRKNCGDTTASDNCGSMTTVNCGACGQLQACGGGGQSNVCGTLTTPLGGTVTSSNPGVAPEDMTKAFDGNTATKWYAGDGVRTGWIAYQFKPAASHTVTSYLISSANDRPARDPNAWQLQGSNDGQAWTTVDTRTGEMFAARFQTNRYTCTTPGAYSHYRLWVTANNGGTDLQLSELQLFGQ